MLLRLRDMVICNLKDFEDSFDAYFWQVYESDNPKRYKYLISITRKAYIRPLFLEDTEYLLEL